MVAVEERWNVGEEYERQLYKRLDEIEPKEKNMLKEILATIIEKIIRKMENEKL
jgi:hypothetical protein